MKRYIIILFLLNAFLPVSAQVTSLNGKWTIAPDPLNTGERDGWYQPAFPSAKFDQVTVPHCFSVDPRYPFYTGTAWYFTTFQQASVPKGYRSFLQFDAVFYKAKVWLNGHLLGVHEGGYTPFEWDVTEWMAQKNNISVSVNNSWDTTTIPGVKTADTLLLPNAAQVYAWMNYGGITRPVQVITRPELFMEKIKIEAEPDLKRRSAKIRIMAAVNNLSGSSVQPHITAHIYDGGRQCTMKFTTTSGPIAPGNKGKILLEGILPASETKLWNCDGPHLYLAELVLGKDTVRSHFGIRKLEVIGTQLLLNGEPVRMGGANRPADHPVYGSLDPDSVLIQDLTLMKNAGMEFSRIAHYAVPERLLDWADKNGMLLITEAGNWQMTQRQMADPVMKEKYRSQLREMIERDWNHPSVIAYSLGNEFPSHTKEGIDWVKEMGRYVRSMDTSRLLTFASFNVWRKYVTKPTDEASNEVDFISANIYGNHLECLQHIHDIYPNKPVYISEFGMRAGNKPESARIDYLQKAMQAVRQCDYVVGASWWSFNDYRSRYPGTDADGYRAWGLVQPDRRPRDTYRVWQEEFAPALFTLERCDEHQLVVTISARKDFPVTTLRNYRIACGDQSITLPVLKPGESYRAIITNPRIIENRTSVSLLKPNGFLALKKEYTVIAGPAASSTLPVSSNASVRMPWFFSENMVLQRQKLIKFFGTAKPKQAFTFSFAGGTKTVKADKAGQWQVEFPPMEAGGPYSLSVQSDSSFTWSNIMIGDVWLCSGQSNMEWPLMKTWNAAWELKQANHPGIRFFSVPRSISSVPLSNTLPASWKTCTPQNSWEMSAVAYFFARELKKRLHIPVGIIQSSWGGTPIEAWTSFDSISRHPDFRELTDSLQKAWQQGITVETVLSEQAKALALYQQQMTQVDKGFSEQWYRKADTTGWKTMIAPGTLEQSEPMFKGSVWFRRSVQLPASMLQNDLVLNLETLNEKDITWFNGQETGRTTWMAGRRTYRIPKEILMAGENTIVIRLETQNKPAGFTAKNAADLRLEEMVSSDTPLTVPLAGEWQYALGAALQNFPILKTMPVLSATPSGLFNGMIAPLRKLGIKGILWYQGENNAGRAFQYRSLLPLLINDWRARWASGDLPFLLVQLAGYTELTNNPVEHTWAELREAQLQSLRLPNTGIAVTIDAGNPYDVHPTNKQIVGRRLAAEARKLVYGEADIQTSPLYRSADVQGDSLRIQFTNARNGLVAKDGKPGGFAIAGSDKKFVWANARIDGDVIVVWSPVVKHPVAVRYAWTGSPVESNGANIYNKEGFPASPFRTDDWRGITEGKK